jgi:kynurenine formamidase
MLLDGSEAPYLNKPDNIDMDANGHILIQEDPGNNDTIARVVAYRVSDGKLGVVAKFVDQYFKPGSPTLITRDEESSGITDVTEFLRTSTSDTKSYFVLDAQIHAPILTARPDLANADAARKAAMVNAIEGGQLYLMTVADIEAFEATHGRIPAGSWVLMRTDWSKRQDPEAYQNFDATGQHTPGPSSEAVQFLVQQRDVLGFGSEAIGTDAGQGYHLRPPYPCHYYMHGAGRYGLQCLSNLDQLPPTGAVLICPPLKIQQGSGSPLRVLALVEART